MRTLRGRLLFSHALVALLSLGVMLAFGWNTLLNTAIEDVEHHLEDLGFAASNALEEPLKEMLEGKLPLAEVKRSLEHLLPDDQLYVLYLPDGSALMTNDVVFPAEPPPEVAEALRSPLGEADSIAADASGRRRLHLAVRIEHEEDVYGVIYLSAPLESAYTRARQKFGVLLGVGMGVLLVTLLGSLLLARSLIRPLQHMERAAQRITAGYLDARVACDGPEEIAALGQAFNVMLDRLRAHMEELRAFVANASHELRTPLTAIKLRTEALRYGGALEDPATTDRFLGDIERHTDRLSRMVEELLDLSRIEADAGRRKRALVNLARLVNEAVELHQARAEKKRLSLRLDVAPGLPSLSGDEDQLRRLVENLLGNAIKFTPPGGTVSLRLSVHPERRRVRFEVQDTGPGIAEKHLPHLFERFYRALDTQPSAEEQGSGLGLAIVRAIAEVHGGTVGVHSRVGEGSTFWVELPY